MKNQYEIDFQQGYDKANNEWMERIDKIRAEIADITDTVEGINPESFWNKKLYVRYSDVLNIIDKYKAESEDKE